MTTASTPGKSVRGDPSTPPSRAHQLRAIVTLIKSGGSETDGRLRVHPAVHEGAQHPAPIPAHRCASAAEGADYDIYQVRASNLSYFD